MFLVLLKFSENKDLAAQFMEAHKAWLNKGFDDGVFVLAGSIQPGRGGAIMAHNISLPELERLVNDDPFVSRKVVNAEIIEITPSRFDDRLDFLST